MQSLTVWLESLPHGWTEVCPIAVFERAKIAYESGIRRYHTWEHVLACVEQLRSFPLGRTRAGFLALVFHDAIYEPGRTDNERRSAELARAVLSECAIEESDLAAIQRMILATRDHLHEGRELPPDEQAMLDIDLSILGSEREAYARYAAAIRDEFVPAAATAGQFRIGRREFLARTLAAEHIFLTVEGRARWEATARSNLSWEAAQLGAR